MLFSFLVNNKNKFTNKTIIDVRIWGFGEILRARVIRRTSNSKTKKVNHYSSS